MTTTKQSPRTLGVDTGGTFTDLCVEHEGELRVTKVSSTPEDPTGAITRALAEIGGAAPGDHVVHGTTVALNALLTGNTAKVALVTNEGFRDLIEIGRQDRPDIYALHPVKPTPLVPRELRFEIPQRIWPKNGEPGFECIREPTAQELKRLAGRIQRSKAEAIAVCLLHSWADPSIEERVGRVLEPLGLPITYSARILPEHREVERFSTALVNAALSPRMRTYLGGLERKVGGARLSILQSSGGTLSAERAALEPVRVILSGPAGGVVGAAQAAREAGFQAFCGLDMGGTSADVCFHDMRLGQGGERRAQRGLEPVRVAGHPIAVPSLDIHTIGCGGGSLVSIDDGGVLHVGPESAGADPGPVCYGKSEVPTITDAHVLLGHVDQGIFLGGALELAKDAVRESFERVGRRLGVSAVEAARGVLDVANAAMRRAIGVMTMQRGEDPAALPLVAFGGAGGLAAAALVTSLRMRAALIPLHPGALSARGMTVAEPTRELSRTVLAPLGDWSSERRRAAHLELAKSGTEALLEAGFEKRRVSTEHGLDLRYRGQSFEIHVPEGKHPRAAFDAAHELLYGYALPDREVELVRLRTRVRVPHAPWSPPTLRRRALPKSAVVGERTAVFDRARRTRIIDRSVLRPGHTFEGPALVEEYSGTTIVPPGWRASVSPGAHLILEPPR